MAFVRVGVVVYARCFAPSFSMVVLPVCMKVINDIKEASKGLKDLEAIEGKLQTVCSKLKTPQEKKLVGSCGDVHVAVWNSHVFSRFSASATTLSPFSVKCLDLLAMVCPRTRFASA
jgi:hypothetical protein